MNPERTPDRRPFGSPQEQAIDDRSIAERWRNATPEEHGRTLWGLLEFADLVQAGRTFRPEPEPLRRLPRLRVDGRESSSST